MPVSCTSKRSRARVAWLSSSCTRSTISPLGVNLRAFESRLSSTWRRREGSPFSVPGTRSSSSMHSSSFFSAATIETVSMHSCTTLAGEKGMASIS